MTLQNNKLDFSNQHFYIGLDVHKKTWAVTIRSMGLELKRFSTEANPKTVYEYMQKNYPNGKYFSVYESGFCGYWIHRQLENYGFKNIVVNPAEVPTSGKEKLGKLDSIDSRKLARELENKSIKGIYIPNILQQEMRSLCRLRYQQIKKQTRLKNQIKCYLNFYGHKLPENSQMQHWSRRFIEYLKTLEFGYQIGQEQLSIYIEELISARQRLVKTIKALRKYCQQHGFYNDILLMCSAPGIGFTTAVTLYTELMDIKRFSNFEKLACYVGLIGTCQ
jgi:transposase